MTLGTEAAVTDRGARKHNKHVSERDADDIRALAARMLAKVMTGRITSTRSIVDTLARTRFEPDEASLLHALVMGVLKHRLFLEFVLNKFLSGSVRKTPPLLRECLLVMAYQLLFLDGVAASTAVSAAVDFARMAVGEWSCALVNAVGRRLAASSKGAFFAEVPPHVLHSVPDFVLTQMRDVQGRDPTPDELAALSKKAAVALRPTDPRISVKELAQVLELRGIVVERGRLAREALRIKEGKVPADLVPPVCLAQDEASQLAIEFLRPRPAETILDLCCGGGIKTSQMLRVSQGTKVVGVDRVLKRLTRQPELFRAMQMEPPPVLKADGLRLPFPDGAFDAVLLDVPCTGLGTLVRRPEVRYLRGPEDLREHQAVQRELLWNATRMARPAGRVLYCVCSFARAECEDVVMEVARRASDVAVEPLDTSEPLKTREGFVKTLPWRDGVDGFFFALLRRAPPPGA